MSYNRWKDPTRVSRKGSRRTRWQRRAIRRPPHISHPKIQQPHLPFHPLRPLISRRLPHPRLLRRQLPRQSRRPRLPRCRPPPFRRMRRQDGPEGGSH